MDNNSSINSNSNSCNNNGSSSSSNNSQRMIIRQCDDINNNNNNNNNINDACDYSPMMEAMLIKERTTYAQHDYFARTTPLAPPAPPLAATPAGNCPTNDTDTVTVTDTVAVDASCRFVMAKWCISLCKFCNYEPVGGMVASIMSCVDLFVSSSSSSTSSTTHTTHVLQDRDQYQLAVMASLYLVAKIQQTQALEPASMAKLSKGKYSKDDIETMELSILTALKWRVNPPTAADFAHEFLRNALLFDNDHDDDNDDDDDINFIPEDDDNDNDGDESTTTTSTSSTTSSSTSIIEKRIIELVNCQIEEATCDYELSCLNRPSHVAFGALWNALEILELDHNNNNYDSDVGGSMSILLQNLKQSLRVQQVQVVQMVQLQTATTATATVTAIDDDITIVQNVSTALLRVLVTSSSSSSSESSNSMMSALLTQRCCGRSSNSSSSSSSSRTSKTTTTTTTTTKGQNKNKNETNNTRRRPSLTKTASSSCCFHSSPRSVVDDGILC